LAGCSFSYQLDNLFAKADQGTVQHGGSLRLATPRPVVEAPSEGDLTIARAVASDVLTKGDKDVSMSWENPTTGARGTVTPLASAYTQDGNLCRDFLASYVKNGTEGWLHGAGCRADRGKWRVRSMRPWKNSADVKTSPQSD
jgi:17 kDa outer membrane surface antigen